MKRAEAMPTMQRDKTGNVAHAHSAPALAVSNRVRSLPLLRQASHDETGRNLEMEQGQREG